MKSLKAIFLVAVVAISTIGLNSCKKDDSMPACVGTWEYSVVNTAGVRATIIYVIQPDGTYRYSENDPNNIYPGVTADYYTETGVWSYQQPSIMLTASNLSGTSQSSATAQLTMGNSFTVNGSIVFIRK